ncbi:hypothetical protein [Gordonia pseudamarae]|nr:hypothetical protein [Gordonia pseudamarae]
MLTAARLAHPERFTPADPTPKILNLPASAWINKPDTTTDHAAA